MMRHAALRETIAKWSWLATSLTLALLSAGVPLYFLITTLIYGGSDRVHHTVWATIAGCAGCAVMYLVVKHRRTKFFEENPFTSCTDCGQDAYYEHQDRSWYHLRDENPATTCPHGEGPIPVQALGDPIR